LAALLSACAGRMVYLPPSASLQHLTPSVVIDQVPFYAQDAYQCGPASLAMMLNYRGLATTPELLKDRVYIPERRGSLQIELVAAARERDLLVYTVPRKLEAILTELEAGNPVLVMQNLAVSWLPRWHYAVAIGYDLDRRELILHSGLERGRRESFAAFMRAWSKADYWGRVMLPPDQIPATAEPLVFLSAASDLEQTGRLPSAELAYRAALTQWPDQPAARFGLGNVTWEQNRREESLAHFRELVTEFPHFKAGWNNLGVALAAFGCKRAAEQAKACFTDAVVPASSTSPDSVENSHEGLTQSVGQNPSQSPSHDPLENRAQTPAQNTMVDCRIPTCR
jgi:tetratricopeptide (TPR) repeat protein